MATDTTRQDQLYADAASQFGAALERLARGYEANPEQCRDLLQDIHIAVWRSFGTYDNRCSLRTWVYRVAHNTATSHILRQKRARTSKWVSLDDDIPADAPDIDKALQERQALTRLTVLIQTLTPQDRQIILLYLEDVEASDIADITGLKSGHIATKIHRIKARLSHLFHEGARP